MATVVTRNANEAMVRSGGVFVWRVSRIRRPVLSWYVCNKSVFSHREDIACNLLLINFINVVPSMRFTKIMMQ
jgi:hypothetical protein